MREIITVCIVEDNRTIRDSLESLINDSVECASIGVFDSAEEAIESIPELLPDVVLMDIGLPDKNGIECIKTLKPLCPGVQFMVCTVYDEDQKIFDALAAGANAYILKRSDSDSLIKAIIDLHSGGSPMSSDIARKVVLQFQSSKNADRSQFGLTQKESQIVELLARGLTYSQAAEKALISSKTIKKHIYNIYEKLHVKNRVEAINKFYGRT
jgi:two-component system, NarL family, response regulator LiaR